jgi:hypothetical protein
MLSVILLSDFYAEYQIKFIMLNVVMLNVVMLNVIMLNVIILNVIMLNVVMLNVIMLNVVAPLFSLSKAVFISAFFQPFKI